MDISDDFLTNIIPVVHMLKYVNTDVVFQEIPNETTLAINISNCPCHCKGCHSAYLAEDIGEILTFSRLEKLIKQHEGITAVCFMGGDNDPKEINHYAELIKQLTTEVKTTHILKNDVSLPKGISIPHGSTITEVKTVPMELKVGWYSGRQELAKEIELKNFNFIKLGPYIEDLGGLKSPTTNQRLYEVKMNREVDEKGNPIYGLEDITNMFWK